MAISFSRQWTDRELSHGTGLFGGLTMRELVPGALERLKGPGHIYLILDPRSFKRIDPVLRWDFASKEAVPVMHLFEIKDVLTALIALGTKIVPLVPKMAGLGEETLVHYSRDPFKTLRPLTYEELVKDRTQGRWEDRPDMAKKYVEVRKRYEGAFRSVLKKAGLPYDPKRSFLYYTLLGKHFLEWAKGRYEHRIPLSPEVIRETFFDVVGLPGTAGRTPLPAGLYGEKGLKRALLLWEKYKDNLKAYKYMGMTIFPRVEILTQKEFTPEIWKDDQRMSGLLSSIDPD